MKKIIPLLIIAGHVYSADFPALPKAFKTSKGAEINNAKISAQNPDSIKVMHDGGIATIPHKQLPPEVLTVLGINPAAQPAEDVIKLPDPLTVTLLVLIQA